MKNQILRIAIAQINPTVGDLEGNSRKITQYIQRTAGFGVDIIVFPELALTGYPPEDLLLKPKFIQDNLKKLQELVKSVTGVVAVIGFADAQHKNIYNAAAVISEGRMYGVYHKIFLPNYGVFDEKRYFSPGESSPVFRLGRRMFGITICEDIWHANGPLEQQAKTGARLIININASPYYTGKVREREEIIRAQAKTNRVTVVYANLVGGQDELVFDGQSMVVDDKGRITARAEAFKEDLLMADIALPENNVRPGKNIVTITSPPLIREKRSVLPKRACCPFEPTAEVYQALLLGLRDYVAKNAFQKVVLGLSGGIDSALVATLAADTLGKDNVIGVFLSTRYSSEESLTDARQLAQNLGIKFINISIEQIYKMYLIVLEPHFAGSQRDITEENLQARIRGNILMALSNKLGWLVLTTGNKSEMSTGYATLYGDMAGGFAVIKDVPKTFVYQLARFRNSLSPVIPERVFVKAPTAELKANQKDSDTLPPYETLDPILKAYIEEDRDLKQIVSLGVAQETVVAVLGLVDKSEYKRRQAPPGIKITPKAFGRDRRMPISNTYRG